MDRIVDVHLLLEQDGFLAALEVALHLKLLGLEQLCLLDGELLIGESLDLRSLLLSLLDDERHHVGDLLIYGLVIHGFRILQQ